MIDKPTKILLAAIALGLWANAGISFFRPAAAVAAGYELSSISSYVSSIKSDVSSIKSEVSSARSDMASIKSGVSSLERITRGGCPNSKIC